MEDLTGKQFGHYQIVAPLGEGGMAAVYKAYQPSMERFVAIKVLPRHMASSEEFLNRFRREAKLLAQLQHPHILPVFDYGESDGYPYIVMPFVNSGTLSELIQKLRPSLAEVRRIMTQLGDALSYAHTRGMIHRDIKPSNVLIDERDNCLLTDFGLARMTEDSIKITTSGTVMGTPAYMSPEQGAGSDIDNRSDIYSLGIILYEMVTGRIPYTAETPIAIVFKHIQDPLPSARKLNPTLPESVELVLLKALAKNPADRYQKADDFVQAIQKAIPDVSHEEIVTITDAQSPATAAPTAVTHQAPLGEETIVHTEPVSSIRTIQAPVPVTHLESKIPAPESAKPRRLATWIFAGIGVLAVVVIGIFIAMNSAGNTTSNADVTNIVPNTIAPISSPVPSPTSIPPVELSAGESFRDDFDGKLAGGWTWMAEDPSKWSLSEVAGSLQIIASDASFSGPVPPSNILLRNVPAGDFDITVSLRFAPVSNFQFAGLVVFQDHGNALQFGRAFCSPSDSCIGDGIYFDNLENSSVVGDNFRTAFREPVVYLRLQRIGKVYSGYYSKDGKQWIRTGEHVRDFSQVRVGLMAAQSPTGVAAVFDDFTMNVPATVTMRTGVICRVVADERSDVSIRFGPGMSVPVHGVSLDGHWLNVHNPENPEASCWIPFDAATPEANTINATYECTDPLGCVQIGPSDPLHIAFWGVLSGADASLGMDAQRGVEIAIADHGGKLGGHDIVLTAQDAKCTKQGGAAAAQGIASDKTIVALIGSSCSEETLGGIGVLTEAGLTTISPSNTRASLTDENRGPEYAGYLRTAPNDMFQGQVVARFVYDILGIRRVAIIHDETSYSTALQRAFAAEFTHMGGEIVAQETISNSDTDMRGVLTRIAGKGPELIYYPVFVAAGGYITAQTKDVPGLENVKLMASDGVFAPEFLTAAGPAAQGMYISGPDFNRFPGSYGPLVDKYLAKYGGPPLSIYHAHAYDAANLVFSALMKIAVVEGNGTIHIPRLMLRTAIYATKDFNGITGTLTCSPSGDCSAPAFAIYEVMNSDPAAWNPQDPANPNPKKIYP